MRVVVPDLENIVCEYLKYLHENIDNPNKLAEANYDWILLEMYDQTVRNYSGGQMAEILKHSKLINEQYIINRIGYVGKSIRDKNFVYEDCENHISKLRYVLRKVISRRVSKYIFETIKHIFSSEAKKIGSFRLSGEIHMWMYDRFSLSRLLKISGFVDIEIQTPYISNIPQWSKWELDVKDGKVYDPTSLFMEGRKPKQ